MSEDVYARAGIPMPMEDKPEKEQAEPYIKSMDGSVESENTMPSLNTDWLKREEDERDRQLRIECLKLVDARHLTPTQVRREAEKHFEFVKNGLVDPLVAVYVICGTCPFEDRVESRDAANEHLSEHMNRAHPELYEKFYS